MGITDGVKASSSVSKATMVVGTDVSERHLPQMVVTSAEGMAEEVKLEDFNGIQPVEERSQGQDDTQSLETHKAFDSSCPKETEVPYPGDTVESDVINENSSLSEDHKGTLEMGITQSSLVNGRNGATSDVQLSCGDSEQEKRMNLISSATIQQHTVLNETEDRREHMEAELRAEPEEATKSPLQSATQRPLILDSETACKHPENSTVPESIYEVIEPKDRAFGDQGENTLKELEKAVASDKPHENTKEADSFFARSKGFWKHDKKHIFSFPKFSFGTKEPKESKGVKKEAHADVEIEAEKESKRQEYSLEAAVAANESCVVEKYRKIDADSVIPKSDISQVVEPENKLPTNEVTENPTSCPKTTDRSTVIHPKSSDVEQPTFKGIKAESEDFEIEQQTQRKIPGTEKRESSPESLYDTCCLKLAVLLRNKALEIASDNTKSSVPKKPPKPTPEALAKARAAVATKKLKEYESRPLHFGDNIPAGYDGLRYADEDTESSNDYKDVDNFGILLNPECYGIIRRLKTDNKSDSFRASSTCSGLTSYYTAETETLKGENSSDNTLETVSLGSSDSIVCKPSSSSAEKKNGTATKEKHEVKKGEVSQGKHSVSEISSPAKKKPISLFRRFTTPKRKIPPPIPPKPAALLKSQKGVEEEEFPSLPKPDESDITRCVNSLSLSPRPIHRSMVTDSGIQKRPLTMAGGVKEAEFLQLSKTSNTTSPKKSKVVTLEKSSSKTTRNLPVEPTGFSKTLPFTRKPAIVHPKPTVKKPQPPPRPPPPVNSPSGQKQDASVASPPSPLEETVALSPKSKAAPPRPRKAASKQHVSPPRPPLPHTSVKPSSPPARPPPPLATVITPPQKTEVIVSADSQCNAQQDKQEANFPQVQIDKESLAPQDQHVDDSIKKSSTCVENHELVSVSENNLIQNAPESYVPVNDASNISIEEDSVFVEPKFQLVTGIEVKHSEAGIDKDIVEAEINSAQPIHLPRQPRPPPRGRRIRSRTVEVVRPTENVPETRRRSQSLSDIEERVTHSNISIQEKPELRTLYTVVQKDRSKTKNSPASLKGHSDKRSPSLETVSTRPLPPPPLPPRSKSHSASRRSKSDERPQNTTLNEDSCSITKCESMPNEINSNVRVKPPVRKKKEGRSTFSTIGHNVEHKDISKYKPSFYSLKSPKEMEKMPTRPERRLKHPQPIHFDENANIASLPEAVVSNSYLPTDSSPHFSPNRSRGHSLGNPEANKSDNELKGKIGKLQRSLSERPQGSPSERPEKKQYSSWYDKEITETGGSLTDSWEKLDYPTDRCTERLKFMQTPPRRKKSHEKSRFYVSVADDVGKNGSNAEKICSDSVLQSPPTPTPTPTEDKETSPLHIDCSEKSVQTSLETLSIPISHSEMSEDTDDILDLAQTLQDELKTIIKRHKVEPKSDEESHSDDGGSKVHFPGNLKSKGPNYSSSSSEVWQVSSSEESEDETVGKHDENLSEVSVAKKLKKIFYAAQEIVSSEENFVSSLKLLNVDFRNFVYETNKEKGTPVVPEEVLNQILNHLPQLQHLNENLLMELRNRIEHWGKVNKIADVIVKTGPFLKLYSWYIQDFEATLSLLEDSKKKYPLFYQCIKDFEMAPKCKRLSINHYMLKPVQRIPQYRLLLQEYLHYLPSNSEDYQDTVEALQIVSEVANHANESMKQGDNFQKLMSIQSSILGHKEIVKPGRKFIKEGELMKLSRKGMQPRWFVLLNDLLLYLTPVQQGLFRINHELTLAGMKVAIPIQQDYQNEFSIISVTRSFTLASKSPEERQEWIIALTKAIEENASKRSTFMAVKLQRQYQEGSASVDDEDFILGKKAPVWIPDARVTMCQLCTSEFTVTFRRHHCRACGKVICSICSSNRISLQYLGNRIARVCDECYAKLGQGSSACTESGETDSDNQQLAVKSHLRTDQWHHKRPKRQLPSVLKEVCANDKGSTISGYVHRRTNKNWKRNWFVVKDKVLYEYRASEDVAALRSIPLLGFQINTFTKPVDGFDASLLFELSHPGQPPILFHAETLGSAERWVKELKDATVLE